MGCDRLQVKVVPLKSVDQEELRILAAYIHEACLEEQKYAPEAKELLKIGEADLVRSLEWSEAGWWVARQERGPEESRPLGLVRIAAGGEGGWTAVLSGLYVTPEYRRRGIGRLLVETALAEAKEEGLWQATVLVAETNPAVDFYRALGFNVRRQAAMIGYLFMTLSLKEWEPSPGRDKDVSSGL